jgi:hypothetical protein
MHHECEMSLRNSSEGCICDVAIHNCFKFGDGRGDPFDPEFENDSRSKSHKLYFEALQNSDNEIVSLSDNSDNSDYSDDILIDESLVPDESMSYFTNCSCDYCRHIKCVIDDIFEICLCCDTKILLPPDLIIRCEECNCSLCNKCYIHGRYHDERYCYNCRRFSVHKNINYYFPNDGDTKFLGKSTGLKSRDKNAFDAQDDWENASFYY